MGLWRSQERHRRIAAGRAGRREVALDEKLAFLSRPEAYGGSTRRVERIETHFSFVFLTGERVYKLKKPLRGNGFDFSRPDLRRKNAEEEARLNRALSPEVYLGVVPLTLEEGSRLALGGSGPAIDWLVEMVRLPPPRMLDRRLLEGNWRRGDIEVLADRLARFFLQARRLNIAPARHIARFRAEARASAQAFEDWGGPALAFAARVVVRRVEAFLERRGEILARRARERRPVDGHGDLRPEHIALGSTPQIIDRIEFRADLRALDPAEELSFLALECARHGGPQIGRVLFNRYRRRAKDRLPPALLGFYTVMAALIRARLAIRHLAGKTREDPRVWRERAAEYLALANKEARRVAFTGKRG